MKPHPARLSLLTPILLLATGLLAHCGPAPSRVHAFATEIAGASCGTVECIALQADEELLILYGD